jgi:hypothetical protein
MMVIVDVEPHCAVTVSVSVSLTVEHGLLGTHLSTAGGGRSFQRRRRRGRLLMNLFCLNLDHRATRGWGGGAGVK